MKIFRVHTKDAVDEKEPAKKCVICGKAYTGYGNNPAPVKETGRCCDRCNMEKVIPARIALFTERKKEEVKDEAPEIKDAPDTLDKLIASEEQAIKDYEQAIKETEDEVHLELYAHILDEEKEHLRELNELKK